MHFEDGNPKSKGVARRRKYVNLEAVVRKIDYYARIGLWSQQTIKAIKNSLDSLEYLTEEDFAICCENQEMKENA